MRRSGTSLRAHATKVAATKKILDRFLSGEYDSKQVEKLFCKCYERDSCQGKRQEYSVTD